MTSDQYEQALLYVKQGFSLTPLKANTSKGYQLPWGEKNPKAKDKIIDTAQKAEEWWFDHPYDNIAILTGHRSKNLLVLDVDRKKGKDGTIAWNKWQDEHGEFPETLVATTPNNGFHYHFELPEGVAIKTISDIYVGVDVRAEGGVSISPPSRTPDGQYKFINDKPIAMADQNVIDFIITAEGYNKKLIRSKKAKKSDSTSDSPVSEAPFNVEDRVYEGGRNDALIRYIGILQAQGLSDEAISDMATTYNGTQFFDRNNQPYPLDKEEFKRTLDSGLSYCKGGITLNNGELMILDKLFALDVKPEKYTRDDTGNGLLFAQVLKDRFIFVDEFKKWYYFNGKYWQADTNGKACLKYATYFYHALRSYACYLDESDFKTKYRKFVDTLGKAQTQKHMIEVASANMLVYANDLDKNDDLLNVQNGTYNLKTKQLQKHNPEDLITKICNVSYNPDASSEVFENYINDILMNDKERLDFYQKMFGLCLTTITSEEFALIVYGATRCGKSTGLEVLAHMLNTDNGYACAMSPDTITTKKWVDGSKPSPDLARTRGCRFVLMSEPKKGLLLDAALLKQLISGVYITARNLQENTINFLPQFTLIIDTNHLLEVNDNTIFTGDKMYVLKFDKHMERNQRDKALKGRLKEPENLSGLLNWCIKGLSMYEQDAKGHGLIIPDCVIEETKQYGFNSDKVGLFLGECLEPDSSNNLDGNDVFDTFCNWAKANGYNKYSKSTFYNDLRQRDTITMDEGKVKGKKCRNRIRNMRFTDEGVSHHWGEGY